MDRMYLFLTGMTSGALLAGASVIEQQTQGPLTGFVATVAAVVNAVVAAYVVSLVLFAAACSLVRARHRWTGLATS